MEIGSMASPEAQTIGERSSEPISKRHSTYYIPEGDLFIQVEQTLFRVHSHFLRGHSPCFPRPGCADQDDTEGRGSDTRGMNEDNPIVVDVAISASNFTQILWVFYDDTFDRDASGEEWLSILHTAEKLAFDRVIKLAVRKLAVLPVTMDPIAKLAVRQRHAIPMDWATDALIHLSSRTEPLTDEEGFQIGLAAIVLIARAREEVIDARSNFLLTVPPMTEVVNSLTKKRVQDVPEPSSQGQAAPSESLMYTPGAETGNLEVEVEGSVFRVHAYLLARHSPVILSKLSQISGEDQANAFRRISLSGLNSLHFSWILWVLYDQPFTTSTVSPQQWDDVRSTAEHLQMTRLCTFAVKQIRHALSVVESAKYIDRYNIQGEWADETWDSLGRRDHPLTAEEGELLGWKLCVKVATLRERHLVDRQREIIDERDRLEAENQRQSDIIDEMKVFIETRRGRGGRVVVAFGRQGTGLASGDLGVVC